ncbi:MAG: Ig-like domain repeat protein [Suipraeoptans sp.]
MISSWTTVNGASSDDDIHRATISYSSDANYTFDIAYTDKAGNANNEINVSGQTAPYMFTLDTVAPTGTVTAKSSEGKTITWNTLISSLTFDFYSNKLITISGTSTDITSPIDNVLYYKANVTKALTLSQLDNVSQWADFNGFSTIPNEGYVVYIKIIDKAGNTTYISTDGLIVDNVLPVAESISPEINFALPQPVNGIYSSDVKVSISVNDPVVSNIYSGIKTVSYRVLNMGQETQSGVLYSFTKVSPTFEDRIRTWSGQIVVNSNLNNSNDVVIEVYTIDNALNSITASTTIKIDTTAPRIDISYDNNSPDSGSYYKDNRTARIVITERNFSEAGVNIRITNSDGTIPSTSGWTKTQGTNNQDNSTYTTTITYQADGDYTFAIDCIDLAGNKSTATNYAFGTTNPSEFTIDKTRPVISVSYDNNSAENEKYFKESRTATISINEHNFDASRVNFELSDNSASPSWSHSGDVHTATIVYDSDGDYTFDISMSDMAGNQNDTVNYGDTVAGNEFTIDLSISKPIISGVEHQTAYAGDIIPSVEFEDTNYSNYNIELLFVGKNGESVDVTEDFIKNVKETATGVTGVFDTFEKIKSVDGVYTLTFEVSDFAGNEESESVTFSSNRFGSTYILSEKTSDLNRSYVQSAIDVEVTEINVSELENIKITLFKNNETITLVENKDYRVNTRGGENIWHSYTYTIAKKEFEDEGVYRLSYYSEDKAGNISENTMETKNMELGFGIDKTNPMITVTNLDSDNTYATENHKVLFSASDNLKLEYVIVEIDGALQHEIKSEELDEYIADYNGEFTFYVPGDSSKAHEVRIVCIDAAGNETVKEIKNFYVTTNLLIRFLNNKIVLTATIIIGILLILALSFLYIIAKRRKSKRNRNV